MAKNVKIRKVNYIYLLLMLVYIVCYLSNNSPTQDAPLQDNGQ